MRQWSGLLLILAGLVIGCGSGGNAPVSKATPGPAELAGQNEPPAPVPPKDAHWTIYCLSIASPDHVAIARHMRVNLATGTKLKDWYVVHTEEKSVLYYGYYRNINDANDRSESERAQRDRATLDALQDSEGLRPFQHTVFVEIDQLNPLAPAEWDLTNAPGYYTLQIQAYKNHPQRKEAAVQAVRDFRGKGIEAYYYHGTSTSTVCIGTWPKEAMPVKDEEVKASNPNEDLLVVPQELEHRFGNSARGTRAVPVDPSLIAKMREYPEFAVNYEVRHFKRVDPKTGQSKDDFDHSWIVKIPRKSDSPGAGILGASGGTSTVQPPKPRSDAPSGTGKLRSIGD